MSLVPLGSFVDEADYILGGCLISKGQIIYVDFFSHHLPLPYYLLGLFYKFIGCHLFFPRYLLLTLVLNLFLYLYYLSKNRYYLISLIIFLLVSPFYYGYYYLSENFFGIGLVLLLTVIFYRSKIKNKKVYFLSIFLGNLFLISSNLLGILVALIFTFYIFFKNTNFKDKLPLFVFKPLSLAVLFISLWLIIQKNFNQFLEQGILFNIIYYSKFLTSSLVNPLDITITLLEFLRDKYVFVIDFIFRNNKFGEQVFYANIIEFILLGISVFFLHKSRIEKSLKVLLVVLLSLSLARYYHSSWFHELPFIYLTLFLLPLAFLEIKKKERYLKILMFLLMAVSLRLYIFNLPSDLNVYPNPYKLSYLNYINRYTQVDDKVLFYPLDPAAYLISDRSPGSFYYFFLPWHSILPDAEDRVISDLEANKVKMVVIEPKAIIWDKYQVSSYSGRIYKYVVSNFRPLDATDSARARVFLRQN